MNKNYYDIIIIGSGIAGLYSAYLILKNSPSSRILILEKYKKKWVGGRWGNELFHGSTIVTGAGIGRKNKDKLLIQLMNEIHVPYKEQNFEVNYSLDHPVDVKKIISYLRKEYKKYKKRPSMTFEQFGKQHLGNEVYNNFIKTVGYTDYEKEDIEEVLYNYGMEDNFEKSTILSIPWKEAVNKLVSKIGIEHFAFSSNVEKINKIRDSPCLFQVLLENDFIYYCNKVIIATTIDSIIKLVPKSGEVWSLYKQIHGQPFLRLYGKFSKQSIPILKKSIRGYTIVDGPLQKIIPINEDKGIYMISYSDNKNALYLKKYTENTEKNRQILCSLLEKSLGIPTNSLTLLDIKSFYWDIGTHYYSPLSSEFKNRNDYLEKIQHPENGMLVVGEAVSDDQGWSEGALRSVERVLTKNWIKSLC